MGKKTRILRKLNKFSIKFANHPILKNNKKDNLIIEEKISSTIEDIVEIILEPMVEEEKIEETTIKQPTVSKKVIKPKK